MSVTASCAMLRCQHPKCQLPLHLQSPPAGGRLAWWHRLTRPSQPRISPPSWDIRWTRRLGVGLLPSRVCGHSSRHVSLSSLHLPYKWALFKNTDLLWIAFYNLLNSVDYQKKSKSVSYLVPAGAVVQGWQADPNTRMVIPQKPGRWHCSTIYQQSNVCFGICTLWRFLNSH